MLRTAVRNPCGHRSGGSSALPVHANVRMRSAKLTVPQEQPLARRLGEPPAMEVGSTGNICSQANAQASVRATTR